MTRKLEAVMFDEIERAADDEQLLLAPNHHMQALVSFVWNSVGETDAE